MGNAHALLSKRSKSINESLASQMRKAQRWLKKFDSLILDMKIVLEEAKEPGNLPKP
jgi:DNA-directed RNA polymerase subunit F